ncbi:MAG: DUF3450 domain-containing protein [Desulfobulbus sp.]|nr:DUF3450 domain-containing protein [Desulfobulbus sp.]
MKKMSVFAALLIFLLVSGCAEMVQNKKGQLPRKQLVVQASEADTILTCLADNEKITRREFADKYQSVSEQVAAGENADNVLRTVCLSLHPHASYKQFKNGKEMLSRYIKKYKGKPPSLQGVLLLMERIDREQIIRWRQSSQQTDKTEGLAAEKKELMERVESLERSASQDQARINELERQLEQLKNIESIIKNRER